MKCISLILLFALIFSSVSSQIEWEELPQHNSSSIEVIHMTKDDRLIGYLRHSTFLYVSIDKGISWELLAVLEPLLVDFNGQIEEKDDGTLHTIIDDSIYTINELTKKVEILFQTNLPPSVKAFFFLSDNKAIVANGNSIQLYSETGNLITSKVINGSFFNTTLLEGKDTTHYYYSSEGLISFNSDLSVIEEDLIVTEIGSTSHFVLDEENNLFTDAHFSKDGKVWERYSGNIEGYPSINRQGDLQLFGQDSVFISQNGGQSFSSYPYDPPYNIYRSLGETFAYGNTGILYYNRSCEGRIMHSDNGVDNWTNNTANLLIGDSFAYNVEAVSDGTVITSDCTGHKKYSGDIWAFLPDSNSPPCTYFYKLWSFPKGSLLANNGCRSIDHGANWESSASRNFDQVFINTRSIYLTNYEQIQKSQDNGETWETIPIIPEDQNIFFNLTYVSVNEQIYSPSVFGDNIYRLSIDGNTVDVITTPTPDSRFSSLTTSFASPNIFILFDIWMGGNELMVYNEESKTHIMKPLPQDSSINQNLDLYVDHGDNLYLTTPSKLYISSDYGDSWVDITPDLPSLKTIMDVDVSWDGYIYVGTIGTPILKSKSKITEPYNTSSTIEHNDFNYNHAELIIYPVPAIDKLNISYEGTSLPTSYEIYDLTGKIIKRGQANNSFSIDIEKLNRGIYIFQLQYSDGSTLNRKILVFK